jgi:hypothetical protein
VTGPVLAITTVGVVPCAVVYGVAAAVEVGVGEGGMYVEGEGGMRGIEVWVMGVDWAVERTGDTTLGTTGVAVEGAGVATEVGAGVIV